MQDWKKKEIREKLDDFKKYFDAFLPQLETVLTGIENNPSHARNYGPFNPVKNTFNRFAQSIEESLQTEIDLLKLGRLKQKFGNSETWKILDIDFVNFGMLQSSNLARDFGLELLCDYEVLSPDEFSGSGVYVAIPAKNVEPFSNKLQKLFGYKLIRETNFEVLRSNLGAGGGNTSWTIPNQPEEP